MIKDKAVIWLCGAVAESLKHTVLFLDENVAEDALHNYRPPLTDKRKKWDKVNYVGNECKAVNELPKGTHVLTVSTAGTTEPSHMAGLSHVITW